MEPMGTQKWSIGAVARATGLSPDTLRVWQRRYGFPVPHRRESGHRLYSPGDVQRLRRISEAIARGHRAGHVVRMTEPGLEALLGTAAPPASRAAGQRPMRPLMPLVRALDGGGLAAALRSDADALGALEFLRRRVVPIVQEVGEAWSRGAIGVHHEHVFSERLEDVLRALRARHERGGRRPVVLLAALPGETHGLGLQMAAVVAAVSGIAPLILGTDTPVAEIAAAARARRCAAVGISVSISTGGPGSRDLLARLRAAVPAKTLLLVGGMGARRSRPPGGCVIVEDLESFADWMRRLSA